MIKLNEKNSAFIQRLNTKVVVVALLCFVSIGLAAQVTTSNSRYLHTQYFENPAYTGISNTMTVNLNSRKQWMGIEGAPSSYHISANSPINNTMMSLGGGLNYEHFGVNQFYHISASYAYLLNISKLLFLSLGISAKYSGYQASLSQLNLVHNNDPYFSSPTEKGSDFNAGTGAFLYGRKFYVGMAVANILNRTVGSNSALNNIQATQHYMGTAGYLIDVNKAIGIKPSVNYQYNQSTTNQLKTGIQLLYKDVFWIGAVYEHSKWLANVFNVRIKDNLEIAYAFDFALAENSINRNNHEITLSFHINSIVKRNKKREFGEGGKEGIKSIRHF